MEKTDQLNSYTTLKEKTEASINSTINELYKLINDKIEERADNGEYKVRIFFPQKLNLSIENSYDSIIYLFYDKLAKKYISEQLRYKFRSTGVKFETETAYHDDADYNISNGIIIICKWDRDYSKQKSCTIC